MNTTPLETVLQDIAREIRDAVVATGIDDGRTLTVGPGHHNKRSIDPTEHRFVGHMGLLSTTSHWPRVDFVLERVPTNSDRFDLIVYLGNGNTASTTISTGSFEYAGGRVVRKDRPVDYQSTIRKLADAIIGTD